MAVHPSQPPGGESTQASPAGGLLAADPTALLGVNPIGAYLLDSWQRSVLFLDVLRRRGNQYREHMAQQAPAVLDFETAPVLDGRSLDRPVNYGLVRIEPPAGIEINPRNRPVVVVDPRAGHGPGIGGFKADSEIGVALRAGHPCYFIGFLPEPVPGQTIEDIMQAEARFLEEVTARHPEAEGKPFVIGNCQAGWAVMMAAAARPELFGPILIAGAPLSYWAGVRGGSPMRYTGGLLGGSWLTALAGDLGHGVFDGAWLVQNFEGLNPANTFWTKQYAVWSDVAREAERYLGFEKWWGGHVLLNAEEIQWIVDNLFVGNRLATGEIVTRDGVRLDLRSITSPIVCFCSKGDDITPPPQALGWILDLYGSVDDIRAHGQTIVYCVHETIGHLGIFVSGKVAAKEHQEFAANIDFIDVLPPGLYEAVITPATPDDAHKNPGLGSFVVRFEARDLSHIRALGANTTEDERAFAAVARLSEVNLGLYRTFLQPFVRAAVTPYTAEWLRRLHPLRLQYEIFADANPFMRPVAELAKRVEAARRPALIQGNPLAAAEAQLSAQIVAALDAYRDLRDQSLEALFYAVYTSPLLQALVGLRASDAPPRRRPGEEPEDLAFVRQRMAELKARVAEGGPLEAFVRAMLFVGLKDGYADERGFLALRRLRADHPDVSLSAFKQVVRDQMFTLLLAEEAAMQALPGMLTGGAEQRERVYAALREVVFATGEPTPGRRRRLAHVARLLGVGDTPKGAADAGAQASRRLQVVAARDE